MCPCMSLRQIRFVGPLAMGETVDLLAALRSFEALVWAHASARHEAVCSDVCSSVEARCFWFGATSSRILMRTFAER